MMVREVGNRHFPIWLIGDSEPERWQESLATPLDPRHPVRHNIWTSIVDVIQDQVYRNLRLRLETNDLYIRNAVKEPNDKPKPTAEDWSGMVLQELREFQTMVERYNPKLVISLGAFSYEFSKRALNQEPNRPYRYWGTMKLGEEFRYSISHVDMNAVNLIPLLHRSIAGGKFIESHTYFCGSDHANYFDYVGNKIANLLIEHHRLLDVWI